MARGLLSTAGRVHCSSIPSAENASPFPSGAHRDSERSRAPLAHWPRGHWPCPASQAQPPHLPSLSRAPQTLTSGFCPTRPPFPGTLHLYNPFAHTHFPQAPKGCPVPSCQSPSRPAPRTPRSPSPCNPPLRFPESSGLRPSTGWPGPGPRGPPCSGRQRWAWKLCSRRPESPPCSSAEPAGTREALGPSFTFTPREACSYV